MCSLGTGMGMFYIVAIGMAVLGLVGWNDERKKEKKDAELEEEDVQFSRSNYIGRETPFAQLPPPVHNVIEIGGSTCTDAGSGGCDTGGVVSI